MSVSPDFVPFENHACALCGMGPGETKLVSVRGKSYPVCRQCIQTARDVLAETVEDPEAIRRDLARATAAGDVVAMKTLRRALEGGFPSEPLLPKGIACSFCDHVVMERKKLVAAPTLYICDACVASAAVALNPGGGSGRAS